MLDFVTKYVVEKVSGLAKGAFSTIPNMIAGSLKKLGQLKEAVMEAAKAEDKGFFDRFKMAWGALKGEYETLSKEAESAKKEAEEGVDEVVAEATGVTEGSGERCDLRVEINERSPSEYSSLTNLLKDKNKLTKEDFLKAGKKLAVAMKKKVGAFNKLSDDEKLAKLKSFGITRNDGGIAGIGSSAYKLKGYINDLTKGKSLNGEAVAFFKKHFLKKSNNEAVKGLLAALSKKDEDKILVALKDVDVKDVEELEKLLS